MYLLLLCMFFTVFDFLAITEMVNVTNISQHAVPSAHKSITYICHVCERSLSLLHWELYQFDISGCKFYMIICEASLQKSPLVGNFWFVVRILLCGIL